MGDRKLSRQLVILCPAADVSTCEALVATALQLAPGEAVGTLSRWLSGPGEVAWRGGCLALSASEVPQLASVLNEPAWLWTVWSREDGVVIASSVPSLVGLPGSWQRCLDHLDLAPVPQE